MRFLPTMLLVLVVLVQSEPSCADPNAPTLAEARDRSAHTVTIAGDGVSGIGNGPGALARFLLPAAVLIQPSTGNLYVSDYAANQIRSIDRSGVVRTFAGVATLRADGQSATGGYKDGPRATALFNRPLGMAFGPDGSMYVADAGNHCIRRVAGDIVTTVVGAPDRAGPSDGSVAEARLTEPRFLAFDDTGGLYISDYGNGLRYFKGGSLTTVKPVADDRYYGKRTNGLAYFKGKTEVLYLASIAGVLRYNIATKETAEISYPFMEPGGLGAFDVSALDDTEAVISSPRWNTLEFLKFPDGLGQASPVALPMTGPTFRNSSDTGGFADDVTSKAAFAGPMGIAIDRKGNVLVADAANRRIRKVPPVDTTWMPNTILPVAPDPKLFTIAIVANSFAYWNTTFHESIEGRLEARLNEERNELGIKKPVRVLPIRLDGSAYAAQAEYLSAITEAGGIDSVVWMINPDTFSFDTLHLPQRFDPVATEADLVLNKVTRDLKTTGTRLLIATMPTAMDAAPTEAIYKKFNLDGTFSDGDLEPGLQLDRDIDEFYQKRNTSPCSVTRAFSEMEQRSHVELFAPDDQHFSAAGNRFTSNVLFECLRAAKPWQ